MSHVAERTRRVYVGVDGSPSSTRALRQAVEEARQRQAELYLVHVRQPLRASLFEAGTVEPTTSWVPAREFGPDLREDDQAKRLIANSLQKALGGCPGDLMVADRIMIGRPDKELSSLAQHDDDLIVVGASRHSRWLHPLRRSVSRYCAAHAHCPVLIVPLDHFALSMRRRLRLSPLHRDLWKEFDAASGRDRQPAR